MNGIGGNFAPNIFGIEYPQISASRIPTFFPCFAKAIPRRDEIVDFPTPPFPEEIPIILLPLLKSFFASSTDRSAFTNFDADSISTVVGSINSISIFSSTVFTSSSTAERTQSMLK